jgi:hypothetical protein
MSQTKTETPAVMIAVELRSIVSRETLAAYLADESGHDSLRSYESLIRIRLGGDYDPSAWDAAMAVLSQSKRVRPQGDLE